jgi:hypothetical protein
LKPENQGELAMNAMLKNPEQFMQSGRDMIGALGKSFSACTSGYHELHQHMADHARQSLTTTMSVGKELFDVKTPNDWSNFYLKLTTDMMSATVSRMAQYSQLSLKVYDTACEPLKECFGAAFEKL